ncbi:hypothetical protein Hokovirus_1_190 [Hokovirus HKV1]|uniref:Uncharacterized protein n=1 Tax=Hokovirus HKV1 TaxID=1977638 RepID=A0A1V0SF58_9VIRU|nr:hypothetical protein Hokovirus_1_190 [Hokovirus HKV1]
MPSISNSLGNIINTKKIKPYYILIIIFMVIIIIIFSGRIFNIKNKYYYIFELFVLLLISSIIILSIIIKNIDYGTNIYLDAFSDTFNTRGSRNFFAIVSLILFIMYIYEVPLYNNNDRSSIFNAITLNNNNYVSNKSVGLFWIIIFTLYISVSVYLSTS